MHNSALIAKEFSHQTDIFTAIIFILIAIGSILALLGYLNRRRERTAKT